MLYIDTKAYILRLFLDLFLFYGVFFFFYPNITYKMKYCLISLFLPITFFLKLFIGDWADMILMIGIYVVLTKKKERNLLLLNTLLFSMIIVYFVLISVSFLILPFISFDDTKGFLFVSIEIVIQVIVLSSFLCLYQHLNISTIVKEKNTLSLSLVLGYLYVSVFLCLYATHYFAVFEKFIFGIVLFVVIQSIFIIYIFWKELTRQGERYSQDLLNQQLSDLTRYTDQLESYHQRIRQFKHDHANLVLSLKQSIIDNDSSLIRDTLDTFETYSTQHFESADWLYEDIQNVHHSPLKSLLVSKLFEINQHGIPCQFECRQVIKDIPIHPLDLVRIVGISLDNAIEESIELPHAQIQILVYGDDEQVELLIENTCYPKEKSLEQLMGKGYSSKPNHSGFGLYNIQQIKGNYSNVFILYQNKIDQFSVQLVITFD